MKIDWVSDVAEKDMILINFRADEELNQFLEEMKDNWDTTKSDVIRTIIRSHMGLLEAKFLAILKDDNLDRWGDMGRMLRGLKESEKTSNAALEAQLKDVVKDYEVLIGAEMAEVREGLDD